MEMVYTIEWMYSCHKEFVFCYVRDDFLRDIYIMLARKCNSCLVKVVYRLLSHGTCTAYKRFSQTAVLQKVS